MRLRRLLNTIALRISLALFSSPFSLAFLWSAIPPSRHQSQFTKNTILSDRNSRQVVYSLVGLKSAATANPSSLESLDDDTPEETMTVTTATELLAEWDKHATAEFATKQAMATSSSQAPPLYVEAETETRRSDNSNSSNTDEAATTATKPTTSRATLAKAVRTLSAAATSDRDADSAYGRCLLGICAGSATDAVGALGSYVTALELPRGLLHGMDKDGVALDLQHVPGVYVKYNSGGVYTFADIRASQVGFDALWKPGDALLEEYDGVYRGVYFQVELKDGEFRQFLVPLDLFQTETP